ncbi:hypothetical protein M0802_008859 [Mischocyttarus mexicanus]|nr:hypothetical protein M0802_008859 [Mischocyttarus mexicanus]
MTFISDTCLQQKRLYTISYLRIHKDLVFSESVNIQFSKRFRFNLPELIQNEEEEEESRSKQQQLQQHQASVVVVVVVVV